MIELYNALKFLSMLFFYQKISTFNLGVVFLKSVSIDSGYSLEPPHLGPQSMFEQI